MDISWMCAEAMRRSIFGESLKELYDKNKSLFIEEFKSIQYAEITPQIISGNPEYDKTFFKQLTPS